MYLSIKNSSCVFKMASAFYLGFAREWVRRHFLISKVSAGNMTLCRGQHVAREIRDERICCR